MESNVSATWQSITLQHVQKTHGIYKCDHFALQTLQDAVLQKVVMQTWHGAIQPAWPLCVGQPQLILLLVLAVLLGAAGALGGREVLPDRCLSLFHLLCAWLGLAKLQLQRHQKVGTKLVPTCPQDVLIVCLLSSGTSSCIVQQAGCQQAALCQAVE